MANRKKQQVILQFLLGEKKLLAQHHDRQHILDVVKKKYPEAVYQSEELC